MKKIYKIGAVITPITISVGSLATYFAISFQDTNINISNMSDGNNTTEYETIYDRYKVFPELRQEDFYDDIRIIKGKGVIDDQMVAKILNYIFDHMEIAEGDIGWSTKRLSNKSVIIAVKWYSSQKTYQKNYKIDLDIINSL